LPHRFITAWGKPHPTRFRSLEETAAKEEVLEAPTNGWGHLRQRIRKIRKTKAVRDYVEPLLIAVLIALTFRHFLFEPYKIPSGSMRPTLMDEPRHDKILVKKFAYGVRLPFGEKYYFYNGGPQRWDIIVFPSPEESKTLVKRVVALSGETFQIKDNAVYINGEKTEGPPNLPGNRYYNGSDMGRLVAEGRRRELLKNNSLLSERMQEEIHLVGFMTAKAYSKYGTEPTVVPEGHVFVLGDNNANSKDGRQWGFVPIGTIKGKAVLIWWPFGRRQMLEP